MAFLPSVLRFRQRNASEKRSSSLRGTQSPTLRSEPSTSDTATPPSNSGIIKTGIKRATRLRRIFTYSASFSYLCSFVFLILVLIGNTRDKPVLNDIYFYKLVLTDIIPMSIPNASLINSIAQSIGLHDFYQVGLWNFCEGYQNVGITSCSTPQTLYWFNPVEVLMSELLAGATIALPTQVILILNVLRITSQIMFGFFLTATILNFVLIFVSLMATRSRWWSLFLSLTALTSSILVTSASIVGSVISFVFKYASEAQSDLNIHAYVGTKMFVFMWLASGFSLCSFIVHSGMGCCCVSERDIKTGRREVRNGVVQDN
ncbi:SUR7/PalI family-domain-containing protein [Diplogelasinospora grovesii]|uniref:SUR7/PalI family-domain-containing protein n=1 Tax=Diplogelasinospora grovesii TaxID=303347 RepID=A0AAN6SAC7_9PEZI|nr:SUR7/PalI family-domain-containing protein [Diplogelasinospora grovesii]